MLDISLILIFYTCRSRTSPQ